MIFPEFDSKSSKYQVSAYRHCGRRRRRNLGHRFVVVVVVVFVVFVLFYVTVSLFCGTFDNMWIKLCRLSVKGRKTENRLNLVGGAP